MESSSSFSSFPPPVKCKVASFLDYQTAVALSQTSKTCHQELCLVRLTPSYELMHRAAFIAEPIRSNVPIKSVRIPVFSKNTHTVFLRVQWHGHSITNGVPIGECQGRLYVVEHDDSSTMEASDDNLMEDSDAQLSRQMFGGGRVVYKSPPNGPVRRVIQIPFVPKVKKDVTYHLWVTVSGGGDVNILTVVHVLVCSLVFDDDKQTIRRAFQSLYDLRVLRKESREDENDSDAMFATQEKRDLHECCKLFKSLAKVLMTAPQSSYNHVPSLAKFFQSHGLAIDTLSMQAACRVCDFLLHWAAGEASSESKNGRTQCDNLSTGVTLPKFTLARDLEGRIARRGDRTPIPLTRIPFFPGHTKSLTITGNYMIHPESRIFIVACPIRNDTNSFNETVDPTIGRVVWDSSSAMSLDDEIDMMFTPRDDEAYAFFFETDLHGNQVIRSLCLQVTLFDGDEAENIQKCYEELLVKGKLDCRVTRQTPFQTSFHIQLLVAALHFLKENPSVETAVLDFFAEHNIPADPSYLDCLRDFLLDNEAFVIDKKTVKIAGFA